MTASQTHSIPTKLALRRTIKARRQASSAVEREQVARSIAAVGLEFPPLRHANCVALYASLADEPGTDLLRAGLRQLRIRVLLPVVPSGSGGSGGCAAPVGIDGSDAPGGPQLDWAEDIGDLRPGGPLALPEPQGPRFGPAELGKAQVVIAPALAVDTVGTRLGRGRGYYDAALALASPQALILALVHDHELLDVEITAIPRDDHDVAVAGVITPTRWMFFTPSREYRQ
jgi:5-formyltetrahydrofolate cyclo-ligase